MEFKKNDKMFAQWLDKYLSTGYSEKHSAFWNALHYGITSGKSKGGTRRYAMSGVRFFGS
jgi:hypothetical protein